MSRTGEGPIDGGGAPKMGSTFTTIYVLPRFSRGVAGGIEGAYIGYEVGASSDE